MSAKRGVTPDSTNTDKGREGVKNPEKFADVLYGWPLTYSAREICTLFSHPPSKTNLHYFDFGEVIITAAPEIDLSADTGAGASIRLRPRRPSPLAPPPVPSVILSVFVFGFCVNHFAQALLLQIVFSKHSRKCIL